MNLEITGTHPVYSKSALHMAGEAMIPDERVLSALHSSRLVEGLRDFEVDAFASLFTLHYFEVSELVAELDDSLKDALMILVEGELEVNAMVGNESVMLHLIMPGDMARIISFIGGSIVNISARIKILKNSAVLLLQRPKLESLLQNHPAIVYGVMRNLIQHVHGVARRTKAENRELSNYFYRMNGRY